MEFFGKIFTIAIAAIFVQNYVLMQFLGLCPYIGVSKKTDSAFGMGMAVIFVMTLASVFTFLIQNYLLNPFNLGYLQTIAFILTIASLVQFVEMAIQKMSPSLYKSLGVFLPLITTNCAVLGVSILNITKQFTFIEALFNGFFAGVGFTLVIVLMAGVRERLEKAEVPVSMKGMPIALVVAGCMALAFLGFAGMKI
jgi:electron transport complex protein RnfA